jgi:hypothetical protein
LRFKGSIFVVFFRTAGRDGAGVFFLAEGFADFAVALVVALALAFGLEVVIRADFCFAFPLFLAAVAISNVSFSA